MTTAPPALNGSLHVVVMGVSGSGKSVVGEQLAERLALPLIDCDDFHPPGHVERVRAGQRLTEADRAEWLQRLATELRTQPRGAVLTCPALRRSDREALRAAVPALHVLHLALSEHQALERLASRTDQFYPPRIVGTDFATLEAPDGEPRVHTLDATEHVDRLVEQAARWLAPSFNNA
jgi:gluconokinase